MRGSGVADSNLQSVLAAVAEVLEEALAVEHESQVLALLLKPLHVVVHFPVLAVDAGLDVDAIEDLSETVMFKPVPVCDSGLDTVLADSARQVAALMIFKKKADGFGGGFDVSSGIANSSHGQCSPVLEAIVASMHGLYHAIF